MRPAGAVAAGVLGLLISACTADEPRASPPSSPSVTAAATRTGAVPLPTTTLAVTVLLTELCPHEPASPPRTPDPACAPRPLAGAPVVLLDDDGHQVASGRSDDAGLVEFGVAPGRYRLQGEAFDRWPRPPAVEVRVGADDVAVDYPYATGTQ